MSIGGIGLDHPIISFWCLGWLYPEFSHIIIEGLNQRAAYVNIGIARLRLYQQQCLLVEVGFLLVGWKIFNCYIKIWFNFLKCIAYAPLKTCIGQLDLQFFDLRIWVNEQWFSDSWLRHPHLIKAIEVDFWNSKCLGIQEAFSLFDAGRQTVVTPASALLLTVCSFHINIISWQ